MEVGSCVIASSRSVRILKGSTQIGQEAVKKSDFTRKQEIVAVLIRKKKTNITAVCQVFHNKYNGVTLKVLEDPEDSSFLTAIKAVTGLFSFEGNERKDKSC